MSTVALHHELAGPTDAAVVVLSGSLGTTCTMWEPQASALSDELRVLRYDHRGHGDSPAPPGPYSLDELGSDLVALLDTLGIDRVGFCGLSMGGFVGIWLATRHPERVSSLLLASTSAHPGNSDFWRDRASRVRSEGMGDLAAGTALRWFSESFVAEHPEVVEPVIGELGALCPEGYASCCEAIAAVDLRDVLGEVAVPALVVTGSVDVAISPENGEALAAGIPGARLVAFEGVGHLLNLELPETFNALARTHFGAGTRVRGR